MKPIIGVRVPNSKCELPSRIDPSSFEEHWKGSHSNLERTHSNTLKQGMGTLRIYSSKHSGKPFVFDIEHLIGEYRVYEETVVA